MHGKTRGPRTRRTLRSLLVMAALALTVLVGVPGTALAAYAGFPDVGAGDWYVTAGHLDYVVENQLITGYGDGTFGPSDTVSRGQMATILWRIAGEPKRDAEDYPDVKYEAYYGDAIEWARYTGVITGYENGEFGPEDPVTREQLATMLARYADKVAALDVSSDGTALAALPDSDKVSDFGLVGMRWAVDKGLITGDLSTGVALANPQGSAERCQVAKLVTIFHRDLLGLEGADVAVDFHENVERVGAFLTASSNGTTVTLPADSAKGVEVGDIILTDQTNEFPSGLAIKVKSVTRQGSNVRVSGTQPSVEEVYEQLDVNQTVSVDASDFRPAAGFTMLSADEATPLVGGEYDIDTVALIAREIDLGEYGKISGRVDITPKVVFDLHFGLFTKTSAKIGVAGDIVADFNVDVHAVPEEYRKIKLGDIPVFGEPITNTGAFIVFYLNMNLDGSFDLQTSLEVRATVSTDEGVVTSVERGETSVKAEVDAKIGPSAEVSFLILNQSLASAGLEAGAQGTASLTTHDDMSLICTDFKAFLYSDFYWDVFGVLDLGFNKGSKAIMDANSSIWSIVVHLENGTLVPECTWGTTPEEPEIPEIPEIPVTPEEPENPDGDQEQPGDSSLFASLPNRFLFSSGAGGWATELFLNDDGTFEGLYYDFELGATGPGYPSGTLILSRFHGAFEAPTKRSDHTYDLKVKNLELDWTPGTSQIANNTLYEFSDAYGIGDCREFTLCVPGAKGSEIPSGDGLWTEMTEGFSNGVVTGYYIVNESDSSYLLAFYGSPDWEEYTLEDLEDRLSLPF